MDINLSELAREKIMENVAAYNETPVVRIYVESISCSKAKFGIAFDYIKDGDHITEVDGIKFITDSEYVPAYSDGIDVDYVVGTKEGFVIKSIHPVSISSGCGCGGGGGCGCKH
jgi:Fe-S cluster assembly iron-binding protein IscA